MAFGPQLQLEVPSRDEGEPLVILLAPLTREVMPEFVKNGGMQSYSVTRYLGSLSTAPVVEDELDWFEKTRKEKDSIVWGVYVCEGENRKLIGNTSLSSFEHGPLGTRATSGVLIFDKAYWNKGIASYIHKARTWFAFTQLGVMRIESAVICGNVASLRALEKSGYVYVYTERNTAFVDGGWLHQDTLECLNPLDAFWRNWWHGDAVPKKSREARRVALEVLDWAKRNVAPL